MPWFGNPQAHPVREPEHQHQDAGWSTPPPTKVRTLGVTAPSTGQSPSLSGSIDRSDPLKHRKPLPKLDVPKGLSPSEVKRIFEQWVAYVTLKMGTWGEQGPVYWMTIVTQARIKHEEWLDKTPQEQALLETSFMLGQ